MPYTKIILIIFCVSNYRSAGEELEYRTNPFTAHHNYSRLKSVLLADQNTVIV